MRGRLRQIDRQLGKHPLDRLDLAQQGFARLSIQVAKVGRDQEMTLRFGRGAKRDLKEANRLLPGALPASFRDIARDGDGCTAKLSSHHTVIGTGEALGANVDRHRELARALPDYKASEIMHARRVRSSRTKMRTLATPVLA